MNETRRVRQTDQVIGALMAALTVLVVICVYAGYRGAFSDEILVHLRTQRAGLLLETGAPVRILGVKVGTVRQISASGDTADITLGIDSGRAQEVPDNTLVQLKPTTIFGAKYVELELPAEPSGQHVVEGSTLRQTGRPVESNEVFENIVDLLDTVQPQKVNAALTAVAGGLDGRGQKLGKSLDDANEFLAGIEPSLDQAEQDVSLATKLIPSYRKAYPDLVDALDNFRTTSGTLVSRQPAISTFLQELQVATGDTTALAVDAAGPLGSATKSLDRPTATLNRYAPMMECFIRGAAKMDRQALPAFLKYPGVVSQVSLLPRIEPYKYPEDLPKVGIDTGPNCYGLPNRGYDNPIGPLHFDDGITP